MGDHAVTAQKEGGPAEVKTILKDDDSKPRRAISDIGAKNRLSWYNFFSRGRGNVSGDGGQEVAADEGLAVTAASSESEGDTLPVGSTPSTSEEHSSSLEEWFLSNEEEHEKFISEVQLDTLVILEVEEEQPARPVQKGDWYTLLWRSHSESSSGSPSEGERRWSIADDFEVSPVLTKIMEEDDHEKNTDNNKDFMCDLEHLEMTKDGRFAPLHADPEEILSGHHPVHGETEAGTEFQKDPARQEQIEKSLMRWLDAGFQSNVFVEETEWEGAEDGTDDSYEEEDESYDSDDEDEDGGDVFYEEDMTENSPEAFSPFLQGQGSATPNESVSMASYFGIASPYVRSTLQRRLSVILERSDSDSSGTEQSSTGHDTNKHVSDIVKTRCAPGKQPEYTTTMTSKEANIYSSVGRLGTKESAESKCPSMGLLDNPRDASFKAKETFLPSNICPGSAMEENIPLIQDDILISPEIELDTEKASMVVTENVDSDVRTCEITTEDVSPVIATETKTPSIYISTDTTVIRKGNELDKATQLATTVASSLEQPESETADTRDIEKGQHEPDSTASLTQKEQKVHRISVNSSTDDGEDVNKRNDINANNIRTLLGAVEVETTTAEVKQYINMTSCDSGRGLIFDVYPTVETAPWSITTSFVSNKDKKETKNKAVEGTAFKREIIRPEILPEICTNEKAIMEEVTGSLTGQKASKGNSQEETTGTDNSTRKMGRIDDNDEQYRLQISDKDNSQKISVDGTAEIVGKTDTATVGNSEADNALYRLEMTGSDGEERTETDSNNEDHVSQSTVNQIIATSNRLDECTASTIGVGSIAPRPGKTGVTVETPQVVMREDVNAPLDREGSEEHNENKSRRNDSTKDETTSDHAEDIRSDTIASAGYQECSNQNDCKEQDRRGDYRINDSVPEMQMMSEWLSTVLTTRKDQVVSESSSTDSDSEDESGREGGVGTEVYVCAESGSDSDEELEPNVTNPTDELVRKNKKGRGKDKCILQ
uniref:Uncharacterized protein n=1 Tax=Branchiostoma floridae TaxID=7739 RepID=C3ZD13_BRAFL|eukprot:XP_002593513.1 hypothetical protein BRAFLDRAFT_101829 [Branchiostoma floridae]